MEMLLEETLDIWGEHHYSWLLHYLNRFQYFKQILLRQFCSSAHDLFYEILDNVETSI